MIIMSTYLILLQKSDKYLFIYVTSIERDEKRKKMVGNR